MFFVNIDVFKPSNSPKLKQKTSKTLWIHNILNSTFYNLRVLIAFGFTQFWNLCLDGLIQALILLGALYLLDYEY